MEIAKSIDVEDLTKVAHSAAKEVLGGDFEQFGGKLTIGRWPIGTIGLIWRNPDFEKLDSKQLVAVSEKMVAAMGPVVGEVKPMAIITKDFATAGYFPVNPIDIARF